jgi:hypothetical protein
VENGLNAITVEIADECGIIVVAVLGIQTGSARIEST